MTGGGKRGKPNPFPSLSTALGNRPAIPTFPPRRRCLGPLPIYRRRRVAFGSEAEILLDHSDHLRDHRWVSVASLRPE